SSWIVSSNIKEQVALNNINKETNILNIQLDSLSEIFITNMSNRELVDSVLKSVAEIRKEKYNIELQAIEENPNSFSAIEILYEIVKNNSSIPKDRIMKILSQTDDIYKNNLYGEGILSIYNPKSIPEIGEPMIDFIAYDTAGVKYSLIDFKGKYILLDFWSIACPPCIMALPETKALDLANREVMTIIGINLDTHLQSWIERSRKDSLSWINLSDGKGTFSGVSAIYGVKGVPTYVLINPEGNIIDKWTGYRPGWLNDRLKKYIADLKI
ncbi:MAG: TlpA disulfide reductase family protein, partial [Bacteroidales bacterium]